MLIIFVYNVRILRLYRLQNNFINNFTHELKTPVTSLRLYLETFARHELPRDQQVTYLQYMLSDVERLTGQINRILNLARIEGKIYEGEFVTADPVQVADRFCQQNRHIFSTCDIQVHNPSGQSYACPLDVQLRDAAHEPPHERGQVQHIPAAAARHHFSSGQLLLSEGSEDMLKQAIHCYLGPGEKVLCPDQSWWYYRSVASEVGGQTITYKLKETGKSFSYDADEMIELYHKTSPRVVLGASPNNPTGNSFRDEDLQRLTEAFRESILILDEAYWGFADEANEHISRLIGRYRNLLILRTFSKFYTPAGARIGYAAAGSSLSRLTKFSSRYLGYNRISEELALAALDSADYYRDINRNIRKDRQEWYRFFDGLEGWRCFRSDANFILVRYPAAMKEPLSTFLDSSSVAIKFFSEAAGSVREKVRKRISRQGRCDLLWWKRH